MIAFSAFDWEFDKETKKYSLTNIDHDHYIQYRVGIWKEDKSEYYLDEVISTHRCNATDKHLFS